jgi:lupus La protein
LSLVQFVAADELEARDKKILKQVEFYFSDSNFPKDKFLKAQAALNADGSTASRRSASSIPRAFKALRAAEVPIATIATFERMKKIGGSLEDVVRVMRSSDQLEVQAHSLTRLA